jgi:hypothetical protein
MPACLAHYQFGQDVLKSLDATIRQIALTFKPEYDCGLQGPDIFFFYQPYRRNSVFDYGAKRHGEPGVRMFAPIMEKTRDKAALSYLLGLLCHYALDKWCHPYVYRHSRGDVKLARSYEHQRMEAAFDKHIALKHGLTKPRHRFLPAASLDNEAMVSLWPGIRANTLKKCVSAERRAIRLLDKRRFLEACEIIAGKPGALTPMTLPREVGNTQAVHVRNLEALYEKALNDCPALIQTALGSMGGKLHSLPGFEANYKGE